jgi:hypothetical protein
MKFGIFDGSISFEHGTLKRDTDRAAFLASALGREPRRNRLVNKEWWHITVDPEPGVAANVLFRGDRLHQVYVLMTIPSDKDKDGWTEEHELERKALHDAWLRREIGKPPYDYAWGSIASEYDAKGCVSEIIVTYAK